MTRDLIFFLCAPDVSRGTSPTAFPPHIRLTDVKIDIDSELGQAGQYFGTKGGGFVLAVVVVVISVVFPPTDDDCGGLGDGVVGGRNTTGAPPCNNNLALQLAYGTVLMAAVTGFRLLLLLLFM